MTSSYKFVTWGHKLWLEVTNFQSHKFFWGHKFMILSYKFMTSSYKFMTSSYKFMTSSHKFMISSHKFMTSR